MNSVKKRGEKPCRLFYLISAAGFLSSLILLAVTDGEALTTFFYI